VVVSMGARGVHAPASSLSRRGRRAGSRGSSASHRWSPPCTPSASRSHQLAGG